ncbi:MAG: DUF418 domain-containing protein [Planctomycetota bacterium]
MTSETALTFETERLPSLDILRGVAVLGILVMNIQAFAMIGAAYENPSSYGDLEGANFAVWLVSRLLFNQKMMTIFALLFGAGVYLMSRNIVARGRRAGRIHARRMLVLLAMGLLHAYGLWHGDILVTYALAGLALLPHCTIRPSRLCALAIVLLLGGAALMWLACAASFHLSSWDAAYQELFDNYWQPSPIHVAEEIAAFRSPWLGQLPLRAEYAIELQLDTIFIYGPRVLGLMLLGIALTRWGFLTGAMSRGSYAYIGALGLAGGVGLSALAVGRCLDADWDAQVVLLNASPIEYWASLLASFGWIGAILYGVKGPISFLVLRPFAAVGRMALTNYLLQSVLCTTLFYGHGFALFGRVSRVEQALIVVAIAILQLGISNLWLRHFAQGPCERLWRALTYGNQRARA